MRLEHVVRLIDWSGSSVVVETEKGQFEGDLLVLAVPGPLTTDIGWNPPLPAEKVRALVTLRYGTGAGVAVQYRERELVRQAVRTAHLQRSHPAGGSSTSRSTRPATPRSSRLDPQRRVGASRARRGGRARARSTRRLAEITGSPVTRLGGAIMSWTDDPFARCIARAPIGDQRETVLREIKRPLGDRVFFTGEHTDERPGPGGMEGAIRSGLRVVDEIASAVLRKRWTRSARERAGSGRPLPRLEDEALLRGAGQYIDDLGTPPGTLRCRGPALAVRTCADRPPRRLGGARAAGRRRRPHGRRRRRHVPIRSGRRREPDSLSRGRARGRALRRASRSPSSSHAIATRPRTRSS